MTPPSPLRYAAALLLGACISDTDLPPGTWQFSPSTMTFDTEIGKSTTRELLITNNSSDYLDVDISRPIVSGACPDTPFDLPSFTRVAPNSAIALRVTHSPTSWTQSEQCLFLVKLVGAPSGGLDAVETDERSLLLHNIFRCQR